jgi:3-oxoacyl-[acyl-carrier protein] reductase
MSASAPANLPRDFNAIQVGDTARMVKTITPKDLEAFAALSGDYNPLHMDAAFARSTSFQKPVAHGMLVASYVSTLIGMQLPGPGALWTHQNFRWLAAVFAGDSVEVTLRVTHKSTGTGTLSIEVSAVNQNGKKVMEGEGGVMLLERHERRQDRGLSERVALVTGASRGIGAAIAQALAQEGASVAVNYHTRADAATDVCRAIEQSGGHAIPVEADICDPAAVAGAAETARRAFGRPVDLLVNNASTPNVPRSFLETEWNEVQALLDVQLRGAWNCCRAVLPGMLEQKSGRIVNVGSILTHNVPPAQWTAFVMAKAALKSLTRSLAVEFGPQGILVNMVSPGMTETESIASIPERLRKVQAMQTPLRRLGAPEDVARAVVFLCSEAGQYLTGADIPVCGGISM